MKKLIFGALLFCGLNAHATLKLQTQANVYEKDVVKPVVGLSYYQPFLKYFALNSWVGYGSEPLEQDPDVNWLSAKAQLDVHIGRFTIAPGYQFKTSYPENNHRDYPYLRVDYKILD
jgi:hypothetical protein